MGRRVEKEEKKEEETPEGEEKKEEAVEKAVEKTEERKMRPALVGIDGRLLKGLVSAISAIVDEATVKLSPKDGLLLSALDPGKTAMIQLTLPREQFSVFDAEDEDFYLVNFRELERVIKRIRGESDVELRLEESGLTVRSVGEYKKTYRLPLLAGEPFEVKSPKVEFKSRVTMMATEGKKRIPIRLPEIISDMELMGTDVQVSVDSDKAVFSVQGDRGEAEAILTREDPTIVEIESEEPSTSVYAISYLDRMTEPVKMALGLKMEMATNKPMKLTYNIGMGELAYWIAPIVNR
jgi:proliferating cell nuclear antigen